MQPDSVEILRRAGAAAFLDELRRLAAGDGPPPWAHADAPLLVGLERWGRALAEQDGSAGVIALVAAAQHGLPRVLAAGGDELTDLGYSAGTPSVDGAPVESQLIVAAAQARDPDPEHRDAVDDAFDGTRQLHAWDDDVRPADAQAYFWYVEVGQCALAALRGEPQRGAADGDSYDDWPAPVSVARGLVIAARGLRQPGVALEAIIAAIGGAIAAAATE